MLGMKERIRQYMRVLTVARKPTKDEIVIATKICAVGIVFIGIIGFVIFLAFLFAGL